MAITDGKAFRVNGEVFQVGTASFDADLRCHRDVVVQKLAEEGEEMRGWRRDVLFRMEIGTHTPESIPHFNIYRVSDKF